MSLQHSSISDLGLRDVCFGLVWPLSVVLLVPVQLLSMIVFDSTGLDVLTPAVGFMVVVPAFSVALLPTLVARRFYTGRITLATAVVAVAAFAFVAAYTMQFYGLCGPGC